MTPEAIQHAAGQLRDAASGKHYLAPLREAWPDITLDDAYAIQTANIQWQVERGRRVIGRKIGLTSTAVQKQLGVSQPDFGTLLDEMSYGDSQIIPLHVLTQPKIEAEIAFILDRDLDLERPSYAEILDAVAYALPALEIVGSRIANWNIGIADTVADNASSSAFVLGGTPVTLEGLDLRLCGMVLERKGEPVSVGAGAACLGHPLNAVTWLAGIMAERGTPLRAGDLVLSGALGPMVPVTPGDVFETRINGIGSVRAVFEQSGEGETR